MWKQVKKMGMRRVAGSSQLLLAFIFLAFVIARIQGYVDDGLDEDDVDLDTDTDYNEDDFDDDYVESTAATNATIKFIRDLKNATKHAGATVRFRCEVKIISTAIDITTNQTSSPPTPSKVSIKWRQHAAHLPVDKRFKQKSFTKGDGVLVGWLRITHLELFDRGWYYCTASRGVEKITSKGFLEVNDKYANNPGNPADGLSTYRPLSNGLGGRRNPGDITTFLPNLDSHEDGDIISTIANGNLPRLSEQTVHNPQLFDHVVGEKNDGGVIAKASHSQPAYNAAQPFCQMYTGQMCKQFMVDKYIFVQPPYTQQQIEENLHNSLIVISQSNEISTGCNKFVLPIMCFSAFPICPDPKQTNLYQQYYINRYNVLDKNTTLKHLRTMPNLNLQRICKQDCILLETEVCSKEYSIAKRHPVLGRMLELEECENLPEEDDRDNVSCLKLGVERAQNVNKDDNCYWDNGQLYRGILDVSITNSRCLRWSHQVHFPLSDHPELIGHNYCRNPGGEMHEPYCYIDHNKRELCGLPRCAKILWTYIIGTAVILLFLIIFALSFYCCKRSNKQHRGLRNMSIPTADKNIYGNGSPTAPPMELNNLLPPNIPPARGQHAKNGFQNVPQYSLKEVSFVEELGEGAFGKVYKGELRTKSAGRVFVAVKSLKENASPKTQADFQREIELISELKHPNIICLLGVVMKQEPMCMLFEYMSEGDLHEFLIGNSPNEGKSLTQLQFLHISIQIAQGMEYLSENHYVHRDLAARNCLVSKDLVVKISDFGLSRDMYSCDYYRVQSKSLLPVRWMPPESILYGKFTTESDVWSYGVVLWEIYSYGLQPYYGYNNQEVINMIRSRKLLPCPDSCPSYCYALMVECWAELAIRRPSFGEISHRLRVWKQNGNAPAAYFKSDASSSGHGGKYNTAGRSTTTGSTTHGSDAHDSHSLQLHHHHHQHPMQLQQPQQQQQQQCGDPIANWERGGNMKRTSGSQSSLTSKSSLGNRTQSTNLSDHQRNSASRRSQHRSSSRNCTDSNSLERLNPRAHSVNSAL